jgi:DHA1 family bicyclomycin/chloramphenicol resistance-like MFS transporter
VSAGRVGQLPIAGDAGTRRSTPGPLLLAVLTSLLASGLFASDVNLPAMQATADALGEHVSVVQVTFSVYLVGLAVAQLLSGSLADLLGRRRVLLGGLALFSAGSTLAMCAPDITLFAAGRLSQAAGAGACMVVGRVLVSDLFEGRVAARVFTTVMPIVGVSPGVAPVVGGWLADGLGWRAPLGLTVVIGLLTFVAVLLKVPETLPPGKREGGPRTVLRVYPKLLAQPVFWTYAINLSVAYIAYFGYLADGPVIFHRMGLGTIATGFCFISVSASYVAGNLVSRSLVRTKDVDRLLRLGFLPFCAGGLATLAIGLIGLDTTPWPLFATMAVMLFGNGFLLPLSTAAGLSKTTEHRGATSGLMGAVQLGAASLSILLVSGLPTGSLTAFGIVVAVVGVAGPVLFRLLLPAVLARTTAGGG